MDQGSEDEGEMHPDGANAAEDDVAQVWEQRLARLRDAEPTDDEEEDDELLHPEPALGTGELLDIDGVRIYFPYRAYESQKTMMQRMIACIRSPEPAHALLESPTGTGKTVAILCGILGAFKHLEGSTSSPKKPKLEKKPNYQLIYATRTQSQMYTIVEQLKQTRYKDTPMTILESRKRTCINTLANPEPGNGLVALERRRERNAARDRLRTVMHGDHLPRSIDDWCRILRDPPLTADRGGVISACSYYDLDALAEFPEGFYHDRGNVAFDIEDIVQAGKEKHVCPYYALREMQKGAKLIICTYNYLLHHFIRKASGLEIGDGTVLVFDEAHNIENVCREIGSMHLTGTRIASLHLDVDRAQDLGAEFREIRNIMAAVLGRLNNWIHARERARNFEPSGGGVFTKDITGTIFRSLERMNLSEQEIRSHYIALINATDPEEEGRGRRVRLPFSNDLIHGFSNILWTFRTLYKASTVDESGNRLCSDDYTVLLVKNGAIRDEPEEHMAFDIPIDARDDGMEYSDIKLKVLCNNPAVIFEPMKAAQSIVVTSGTLSPLASFASELGVDFLHSETMPHVIDTSRVFAAIVETYSGETPLNFSYRALQRNFEDTAEDLAQIIIQVCTEVPNGVLVFFTSKAVITRFKNYWDTNGHLERMRRVKDLYMESENFLDTLRSYRQSAVSDRGGLFLAVLRGKISEGVDFKDDEARAVITVGIPFCAVNDPAIKAKREFNDMMSELGESDHMSGFDWYQTDAFRALNQALGRCIRHANDWGLIFMVESRLLEGSYRASLPSWMNENIAANEDSTDFRRLVPRIRRFKASQQE